MLLDLHEVPAGSVLTAPVCIVGAGAAGITLARRLGTLGVRTLLLEAGGREPDDATQALAKGKNIGAPYFELHHTRLRYFGGSTNHWTGWCRPLDRIDFEPRPWMKYGGWPIGLDDLTPYYAAAQEVCELGLLDYSIEHWTRVTGQRVLPLDPNLATTVLWQFSPPTRFAVKYGPELAASATVEAYLHANVVDLTPDRRGKRVERVRVRSLDGHEVFVKAGAVVLATGAIENARLLLASTQGNPQGLGNGHDVVGRYFMEHPHANAAALLAAIPTADLELYDDVYRLEAQAPPPAIRGALSVPQAVMRRESLLGLSLAIEPKLLYGPLGQPLEAGVRRLLEDVQRVTPSHTYQLYLRGEQAPTPESRVALGTGRDALGMRQVTLDWRLDPLTIASMKRSLELIGAALGKARLGRVYSFFHAPDVVRDGVWPKFTGGYHHMGTTRMGADPKTSVVDERCRVHGLENLYIAGSSVFSTGGFSNPTLTIVALALRLAEHLEAAA